MNNDRLPPAAPYSRYQILKTLSEGAGAGSQGAGSQGARSQGAGSQKTGGAVGVDGSKSPGFTPPAEKSAAQVAPSVTQAVLQKSCGLKPKDLEEQKSETCSVRFQAGELVTIRTKAQLARVSTNTYIRAAALGSDYKQPINPELQKILLAVNRELTSQGNNLNQIAKHLNSGTATNDQAVAMLDAIRVPLVRALLSVKKALTPDDPQP